jgi:hypothetical protein
MSPISKWSWILALALTSLDGWAFEAGSPESRETYWQEFMQRVNTYGKNSGPLTLKTHCCGSSAGPSSLV